MSRTVQQLVASYVALCLAFAGAVGISPALHQWVEHGGEGQAHTHLGARAGRGTSTYHHEQGHHGHELGQAHDPRQSAEPRARTGLFVHNGHGFHAPKIFAHAWRLVAGVFDEATPTAPHSDQNGHDHHSLAQLVASGLVELSAELPRLEAAFWPITFGSFPPAALFLEGRWDAQSASRGPPAAS